MSQATTTGERIDWNQNSRTIGWNQNGRTIGWNSAKPAESEQQPAAT